MIEDTTESCTIPAFAATLPVFDRLSGVYGYDLQFRDGFEAELAAALTASGAEADLWEAMGINDIIGFGRGHVTFPRDLIIGMVPLRLPASQLTVGVSADDGDAPDVVDACVELKDAGYELAIDGFHSDQTDDPLLELADLVWVDAAMGDEEPQEGLCEELSQRGIRTIARGVDTPEQYQLARDAGYWYFLGDFFRRPVIQPGTEIVSTKAHYLTLMQELNKATWEVDNAEMLIQQDVAMTYRLLRFINSAWFGLKYEVSSIRHALVLLGPREVKLWASMLMLRQLGDGKPKELFRRCLIRAKTAEGLASGVGLKEKERELFLMGMLSLVDALADVPLTRALEGLPVSAEIRSALLDRTGPFGGVYEVLTSYELGCWEAFARSAAAIGLDESAVPAIVAAGHRWADKALECM